MQKIRTVVEKRPKVITQTDGRATRRTVRQTEQQTDSGQFIGPTSKVDGSNKSGSRIDDPESNEKRIATALSWNPEYPCSR